MASCCKNRAGVRRLGGPDDERGVDSFISYRFGGRMSRMQWSRATPYLRIAFIGNSLITLDFLTS